MFRLIKKYFRFSQIIADFHRVSPWKLAIDRWKSFGRVYFFLLFLALLAFLRVILYESPPPKQQNFTTNFTITSPITIESSQKVIKNSKYTIKTYSLPYYSLPFNSSHNGQATDGCIQTLQPGDVLKVTGDRYYNTIYADKVEYIGHSKLKPLYKLKTSIINKVNILLAEPHASLLNGMLLGVEPVITEEFREALIVTGVIHVVVVSGYNISLMFSIAAKFLSSFSLKLKVFLGIVLSILYSLIVGFDPPVIRALLMGLIVGVGTLRGEVKENIYMLLVVLSLMIITSPSLFYSVSLQLTFAATFGILYLNRPLTSLFSKNKLFTNLPDVVKQDITASLSAQIFVFPLIVYYFERVSLIGLLVNPLILWLVPLIMFVGFGFILLSFISLVLANSFIKVLIVSPLLLFADVVYFMSEIPYASVGLSIILRGLIIIYVSIAVLSFLLSKFGGGVVGTKNYEVD